jgi:hypothetical protein
VSSIVHSLFAVICWISPPPGFLPTGGIGVDETFIADDRTDRFTDKRYPFTSRVYLQRTADALF